MSEIKHVYEIRPRKDHLGVDLISDVLPFGRLWYGEPNAISNAIGDAEHFSRSHDAVIRVYDEAGAVIETHEPKCLVFGWIERHETVGLFRIVFSRVMGQDWVREDRPRSLHNAVA